MKNLFKLCLVTLILIFFSCDQDSIDADTGAESFNKSANNKSSVDVLDDSHSPIDGTSSTIHRTKKGITINFKTDGLIPGNAYTMWFVVFGDAPGPPSSTHAAGHIVGGSGKGNFSGHISVGDIFDNGKVFNNPLTAEVHMVLRTHGPAQPGMIPDQIHTIDGGCTSGFPSGPVLHPDSDVVGYCANIQVAIHP